jgi:hypothetical protein
MEEKSFAQALDDLNQKAIEEITEETLRCWRNLQQESSVSTITAHIENEHMRDVVTHLLFYLLLQSLLYKAKQHTWISSKRYEELRAYIDGLMNPVKQQLLLALPLRAV